MRSNTNLFSHITVFDVGIYNDHLPPIIFNFLVICIFILVTSLKFHKPISEHNNMFSLIFADFFCLNIYGCYILKNILSEIIKHYFINKHQIFINPFKKILLYNQKIFFL
ncbi:hypothetical protein EDEG_00942 [Edhazardia aedis USNM 41457]|uniref:Uncharacterized protein n=1 Tax=Edhazardia aedis (strain USNM 41457) TaxID=1003232 RepID=J9DAW2_EDHAE|nr:hypothetical protein EDEG_00942 [Edhazardia aedis USNM 41457]|eukprot:EJW04911.1 hypothetical protein EDEG_00942 [Edhazardia aedis USNM 41457]